MGRKKEGNVLFARRVKPELIPVLLKAIQDDGGTKVSTEPQMALNTKESILKGPLNEGVDVLKLKADLDAMTASYEKQYEEGVQKDILIQELRGQVVSFGRLDPDGKVRWLSAQLAKEREYRKVTSNEFDQT